MIKLKQAERNLRNSQIFERITIVSDDFTVRKPWNCEAAYDFYFLTAKVKRPGFDKTTALKQILFSCIKTSLLE